MHAGFTLSKWPCVLVVWAWGDSSVCPGVDGIAAPPTWNARSKRPSQLFKVPAVSADFAPFQYEPDALKDCGFDSGQQHAWALASKATSCALLQALIATNSFRLSYLSGCDSPPLQLSYCLRRCCLRLGTLQQPRECSVGPVPLYPGQQNWPYMWLRLREQHASSYLREWFGRGCCY
jgi:hypothetical protein